MTEEDKALEAVIRSLENNFYLRVEPHNLRLAATDAIGAYRKHQPPSTCMFCGKVTKVNKIVMEQM